MTLLIDDHISTQISNNEYAKSYMYFGLCRHCGGYFEGLFKKLLSIPILQNYNLFPTNSPYCFPDGTVVRNLPANAGYAREWV